MRIGKKGCCADVLQLQGGRLTINTVSDVSPRITMRSQGAGRWAGRAGDTYPPDSHRDRDPAKAVAQASSNLAGVPISASWAGLLLRRVSCVWGRRTSVLNWLQIFFLMPGCRGVKRWAFLLLTLIKV